MKFKTTTKELKEGYHNIISAGYCDLQNLLNYEKPIAYSKGIYGWNFDVYDVNGVAIATGYRGMPSKNSKKATYDLIKEYDKKASGKTAEERKTLLNEFINKVIN